MLERTLEITHQGEDITVDIVYRVVDGDVSWIQVFHRSAQLTLPVEKEEEIIEKLDLLDKEDDDCGFDYDDSDQGED